MSKTLTLAASCVGAQIIDADREAKLLLSDLLSYAVDGAEFSNAFQAGAWDGRSSFFQWNSGRFPAGFAMNIHDELVKRGYTVRLLRKPRPAARGPEDFHLFGGRGADPRYGYQPEAVRQLIKHGMGIARVATGGGKSWIATLAIHRIRRMTLFLTTRGVLMHQMADALKESGFNVGIMGDGEFSPKAINCAMVQTLVARLEDVPLERFVARETEAMIDAETRKLDEARKTLTAGGRPADQIERVLAACAERLEKARPADEELVRRATEKHVAHHLRRRKTIKILEMVEFVIGEEAHEAGGNSYFEIMRHCRNAHYRLALTATPFMRPDAEANMRLMAAFGPIITEVPEKLLIDRGILATPYFKHVTPDCPVGLRKSTGWQRAYKLGIVESLPRNRLIVHEAARAAGFGLPVMILVQQKAHGRILADMLKTGGVRARFIAGEHDQDERRDALAQLKDGRVHCLIGTTILDVGVDVPAVGMIILAGGGKAEVALRQRIGRGLRAKKDGPNVAFIVDFDDRHNGHLRDHSKERMGIIQGTPGFAERVLPAGADFDFAGLGIRKAA